MLWAIWGCKQKKISIHILIFNQNCKLTLFFLSFLKTETSSCFETIKQQQSKPSQHDVFINKAMSQKISPVQCLQYLQYLQLQPHKHLLLLKLINTNKATCWTKQKQIYKSQNNKKKKSSFLTQQLYTKHKNAQLFNKIKKERKESVQKIHKGFE